MKAFQNTPVAVLPPTDGPMKTLMDEVFEKASPFSFWRTGLQDEQAQNADFGKWL